MQLGLNRYAPHTDGHIGIEDVERIAVVGKHPHKSICLVTLGLQAGPFVILAHEHRHILAAACLRICLSKITVVPISRPYEQNGTEFLRIAVMKHSRHAPHSHQ